MAIPTALRLIGPALTLTQGLLELRSDMADSTNTDLVPSVGRAVCRAVASVGYTDLILTPAQAVVAFACGPYWESQNIDAPVTEFPFSGGQCPGVIYDVAGKWRRNDGQLFSFFNNRPAMGPVKGIKLYPDTRSSRLNWFGPDGVEKFLAQTDFDYIVAVEDVVFTRDDGQPDTCGNPPGTSAPGPNNPGTPYGTPQPTTINNEETNITVFSPQLDIENKAYFQVGIDVGGVYIAPTINIGTYGAPSVPGPPAPPPTDGTPQDRGDDAGEVTDDISEEEKAAGLETIGYKWELIGLPDNTSVVPQTNPKVLLAPYGNIALKYEYQEGTIAYSDNLPIRFEKGSLIRAEPSLKISGAVFSKRPDIASIKLTPVRAKRRTD